LWIFEKKQSGEIERILDVKFKVEGTSKKTKEVFARVEQFFRQSLNGEKKNNAIHRRD
jgi:hypothetical protein